MIPKFRAWDKGKKWMVYDVQDAYDGLWSERNSDEVNDYYGFASNFQSFTDEEEFNFMQYTGLKDKYGVEIYEGDVVVDRWANEYTPVFQNGIYMAYNPKHLMQNDPSTQFNIIWKDGCEIIGNIYETPDLLKGADE